ncbi:MAG: nitroreductase family protein [Bacteroidota bacterium]
MSAVPPRLDLDALHTLVRARRTLKVLGDPQNPVPIPDEVAARHRPHVLEALQTAGWAPFHYNRALDGLAEPWRAYVLWAPTCRQVALDLPTWRPDLAPTSKLPPMLAACGALILVTWCPQFYDLADRKPKQVQVDEEHLAASAAMVQTLLLLLTAHGMGTYWSSGGVLGSADVLAPLGIDTEERLLAAVFVEYPETLDQPLVRRPGKHRDRRSDGWIREVTLTSP